MAGLNGVPDALDDSLGAINVFVVKRHVVNGKLRYLRFCQHGERQLDRPAVSHRFGCNASRQFLLV